MNTFIGTAAWNIPHSAESHFPIVGSHLERYASVFNAVEINSTFYKNHKPQTYAKWAAMVPEHFRFSAKLSKTFTHDKGDSFSSHSLHEHLSAMKELGEKFRVLVLQFPGSLQCPVGKLEKLLGEIRRSFSGAIVIEARNTSWVSDPVINLMNTYKVGRVQADPDRCPYEEDLGEIVYERLHGAPEIYRSSYPEEVIEALAETMSEREHWIMFDNTTFGHATLNALDLQRRSHPEAPTQATKISSCEF